VKEVPPVVAVIEPVVVKEEPVVVKEEPVVVKVEPVPVKEEPVVVKEEPVVIKEPVVVKKEPVAVKPVPVKVEKKTTPPPVKKEVLVTPPPKKVVVTPPPVKKVVVEKKTTPPPVEKKPVVVVKVEPKKVEKKKETPPPVKKEEPVVVVVKEEPKPVETEVVFETQSASFSKSMKVRVGQKLELSHIYFERAKSNLLPASTPELNDLVTFLKNNPTIRIRLEGHTDNQGNPEHNKVLSENRVKETKKYLVENGIADSRIEYIGYGGVKALNSNRVEALRKLNRRVEVVIIDK
jgi:outer membrane protein OmpA-like peptidoglycan-associated protein